MVFAVAPISFNCSQLPEAFGCETSIKFSMEDGKIGLLDSIEFDLHYLGSAWAILWRCDPRINWKTPILCSTSRQCSLQKKIWTFCVVIHCSSLPLFLFSNCSASSNFRESQGAYYFSQGNLSREGSVLTGRNSLFFVVIPTVYEVRSVFLMLVQHNGRAPTHRVPTAM